MSTSAQSSSDPQIPEPALRDAPLKPTMDRIIDACPRFRVLVVGKSGVGKSSLINHTFKVELAHVSDYRRGLSTINDEITSDANPRFVLHDSQGYEPGETENFKTLRTFIEARNRMVDVGDRLHAIWLCIAIPFAGGRVFETGDEKIFDLELGSVPIIVVFTRYDQLVALKEGELMRGSSTDGVAVVKKAKEQAAKAYKELCIQPLKKANDRPTPPFVNVSVKVGYEDSLQSLIQITLKHMRFGSSTSESSSLSRIRNIFPRRSSEGTSQSSGYKEDLTDSGGVMLATAQRVDIDSKIEASINVGRKKYWRGLASSANFFGKTLKACLDAIHSDIVLVWNFQDIEPYLNNSLFKAKISEVVQDLSANPVENPNDGVTHAISTATSAISLASTFGHPEVMVIAPVVAGVLFARWVYAVYSRTPETLRCLMAYIVDLTIVMQRLFWLARPLVDTVLTRDDADKVLKEYNESMEKLDVHNDIRSFADSTNIFKIADKDHVLRKIVSLIAAHGSKPDDAPIDSS